IEAALASAERELADARHRLAEARAKAAAQETGTRSPTETAALAAAAAALRASDHGARRRLALRDRGACAEALAARMAALAPWQGEADALARLAVPAAAEIERWKAEFAEADAEVARHRAEAGRLAADR